MKTEMIKNEIDLAHSTSNGYGDGFTSVENIGRFEIKYGSDDIKLFKKTKKFTDLLDALKFYNSLGNVDKSFWDLTKHLELIICHFLRYNKK